MTDKELLEAAAKAYWGDEIDDTCSIRWLEEDQAIGYTHGDNQDHNGNDREFVWNPLENDGDALRLAVKLGLSIDQYPYYSEPKHSVIVKQRRRGDQMRETNPTEVFEVYGEDPNAANRRAIVRAAASMVKEQP